jgi:hypothetical protein
MGGIFSSPNDQDYAGNEEVGKKFKKTSNF